MSSHSHLVFSILQFLDEQIRSGGHSSDALESLEVAKQCLESAYGVSQESGNPAYRLPATLPDLFNAGLATYGLQVSSQDQGNTVNAANINGDVENSNTCSKRPLVISPPLKEASAEDKEEAEKHKAEGNELMKQEKFDEALQCYSHAIERDSQNAVYYCNRAAAYSKLNKHEEALKDCETALKIDPTYSKAFGRKGLAHSALNQHGDACECYKKALELDPDNLSYKQNLDIAQQKSQTQAPSMSGLNLGGMDFTSFLNNPALMNMASSMMANPQMQSLMANMMGGGAGGQPEGQMGMSELLQTMANLMSGADSQEGGSTGMANLFQAGQNLAQQMQQSNPELVEQLRQQYRQPGSEDPANPQNPSGDGTN